MPASVQNNDHQNPEKESLLAEAMGRLFESSSSKPETTCMKDDDGCWEESVEMKDLIARVQAVLQGQGELSLDDDDDDPASSSSSSSSTDNDTHMPIKKRMMSPSGLKDLDDCFKSCDEKTVAEERLQEFQFTEDFVLEEQNARKDRLSTARKLEASEERRLAVEVAQLKGLRLKLARTNTEEDLRWKISNAEPSYASRKMVYAKAAQVAGAELRLQFS